MRVRYYGHVGQLTGYGRAADKLCMALLRQPGLELEVRSMPPRSGQQPMFNEDLANLPIAQCLRNDDELTPDPDAVIVHTLPLDCVKVLHIARLLEAAEAPPGMGLRPPGWTRKSDAALVAYTTWEASWMPDLTMALQPFDQLWLPSRRGAEEHANIAVVPHPFDTTTIPARRARTKTGSTYRFYYLGAWNARKNVNGLLLAYTHAFSKSDDVELVLQCPGTPQELLYQGVGATGLQMNELPRIQFSNAEITDAQVAELHSKCDCYVTATCGEAFNLPMFDACVAGRSVIAPQGHGSDSFATLAASSDLVRSWPEPARLDVKVKVIDVAGRRVECQTVGPPGLTSRCTWLAPDLSALSRAMRRRFEFGLELYVPPPAQVWDWASYETVGKKMVDELQTTIATRKALS